MASDADILAAAILGRGAHDLRNKMSALVGARDLLSAVELATDSQGAGHIATAADILGDGESEMSALADAWSKASRELYAPTLVTLEVKTLLANLEARHQARARLEVDALLSVRVDEQVLDILLARVSARTPIREIVVRREDSYGLSWLVLEAHAEEAAVVRRTPPEEALLKMLDANPLKAAPAWVFGFRLRLD